MHFFNKKLEEKIVGTPAYYEKKKENMKKNDIERINHQLQRIIASLPIQKWKEDEIFKKIWQKANRKVIQSSLYQMKYRNNFENEEVATNSILFIFECLSLKEEMVEEIRSSMDRIFYDTERLQFQLEKITNVRNREIEAIKKEIKSKK